MMVYFDILLFDDRSLLNVRHSERFKLLEQTIRCDKGRAKLVPRQIIDFGRRYAVSDLRKAFSKTIVERGEGLVLKPDDPYFNFHDASKKRAGLCVKLKKDYIGNFGDIGDFAVVGAGFDPAKAKSYRMEGLKWTHFFLACLDNSEQVKRWKATPEFTVVTVVELNEMHLKSLVKFGDPLPVAPDDNTKTRLTIPHALEMKTPMRFAFLNPLIVDVRCFSFDKPGNVGFWTPRFPVVTKIHFDRDYADVLSLAQLQEKAKEATTGPGMDDSRENLMWIANLEGADAGGRAVDAVSQLTATTMPTPSPAEPTQATPVSSPQPSPAATRPVGTPEVVDMPGEPCRKPGQGAVPPAALVAPLASSPSRRRAKAPATPLASSSSRGGARTPVKSLASSPLRTRAKTPVTPPASSPSRREAKTPAKNNGSVSRKRQTSPFLLATPVRRKKMPETAEATARSGARETLGHVDGNSSQILPACRDLGVTKDVASAQASTHRVAKCKYADTGCHLAGSPILFSSSSIKADAEARQLLEDHGILYAGVAAATWLAAEAERVEGASSPAPKRKQRTILFVDSVDGAAETEALLRRIEDCRKGVPRRKREWITVYDWRLLRYLGVLEDRTVENKYYDGFDDPWRRWYCGMV